MRYLRAALMAIALMCPFSALLAEEADDNWRFEATVTLATKYIGSTTGAELGGKPGVQPSFTAFYTPWKATTFYGNVWGHIPSSGFSDDAETAEWDATIGVFHPFDQGTYVDASVSWYNLAPYGRDFSDDMLQFNFELGHEFRVSKRFSFAPFGRAEHARSLNGVTPGWYFHLGSRFEYTTAWEPFGHRAALKLRPSVVYDTGGFGMQPGWTGHARLSLEVPLNEWISVEPMVKVAAPLSNFGDRSHKPNTAALLTFTFKF